MRHVTIDVLTGLHNRRWMNSMFEQESVHAKRESLPLFLMMLDIDYFKKYNDGYIAGDVLPRLTISIGVSVIDEIDSECEDTLIELIAASDEVLYRAKKDGRNCVSKRLCNISSSNTYH
ncbi:MAG: GGDEF domain-containing protein [Gammaproteobacteria bacterium]|nr:GGDEF domain-containing protein [Gammaproteobacteria bacterium]